MTDQGLDGGRWRGWHLICSLMLVQSALAQSPRLVVDLEPTTGSVIHNNPQWITPHEGEAYFFGTYADPLTEDGRLRGLWHSDFTTAGTRMVVPVEGIPRELTSFDQHLVYVAGHEDAGYEPWITDGTEAGTRLLLDIAPNDGASTGSVTGTAGFAVFGDQVFFVADDGVHGRELWVSDGTASGTRLFQEFNDAPGSDSFAPDRAWLKVTGAGLLIVADAGEEGPELWVSDGTSVGTRRLARLHSSYAQLIDPVALGGRVYCSGLLDDPEMLWQIDPAGSDPVGIAAVFAGESAVFGDNIYFAGAENDALPIPWISDGTSSGTQPLLIEGATLTYPREFVPGQERLWFICDLYAPGPLVQSHTDIIATDGTTSNTKPVLAATLRDHGRDPELGRFDDVTDLVPFGNKLSATMRLRSDTVPLFVDEPTLDFWFSKAPFSDHLRKGERVRWDDDLLFAGNAPPYGGGGRTIGPTTGLDPWVSDGTESGTFSLGDQDWVARSSDPSIGTHDGQSRFLMNADPDNSPSYPYLSDGTVEGTRILDYPGLRDTSVPTGTWLGETCYFSVRSFAGRASGYRVGPSPETLEPLDWGLYIGRVGDLIFCRGSEPSGPLGMWRTDGTDEGTWRLGYIEDDWLTGVSPQTGAWFTQVLGPDIHTLWHTDGSTEGTRAVWTIPEGLQLQNRLGVGFRHAYLALEGPTQVEIRAFDPVTSQTQVMATFDGNRNSIVIKWMREINGSLYYSTISRLWRANGDATSGTLLHESASFSLEAPGLDRASIPPLTLPVASWPILSQRSNTGYELWFTDGTPAGTRHVETPSLFVGNFSIAFGEPENRWYFPAADEEHGRELWVTDGTDEGTRMLADVYPGPESSSPEGLTAIGDKLYFSAWTPEHGRELWVVDRLAHTGARRWGGYQ